MKLFSGALLVSLVSALKLLAEDSLPAPVVSSPQIIEALTPAPAPPGPRVRSIVIKPKPQISTRAILFKSGSAELDGTETLAQLEAIGKALADPRLASAVIEVQGHTDNAGAEQYNQRLSEERARAIVEYLHSHFALPLEHLRALGKGMKEPVAGTIENQTNEERSQNRRVTLRRIE
jgi:outer membrane protein OmpA-like peptidoglycan-associated protein